jgi:hypothetical protein
MDGRVYPTYTISSVDVVGVPLFTASSKEAQGLHLFNFEQWTQCRCPAMILTELRCTLVSYAVPF